MFLLPLVGDGLPPFASPEPYVDAIPPRRDYHVGLLVAPCQHHAEDPKECCIDTYGQPEYVRTLETPPVPPYRVQTTYALGGQQSYFDHSEGSPQALVDEQGRHLALQHMRQADDDIEVDNACRDLHDPFPYCVGARQRQVAAPFQPACMDNNQTVDAMQGCWEPANGTQGLHCMQVAYSLTALPVVCDGAFQHDPHCGSFLEAHLPPGSNEDYDATYRLAERRIVAPALSGYVTTTVPLYFAATTAPENNSAVQSVQYLFLLCDYQETEIRVGSSVLVKDSAPTCCCPSGFWWCPHHDEERVDDSGPLAGKGTTASMAHCPLMPSNEDWVMCHRTFPPRLNNMTVYFRCPLQADKEQACPYFPECTTLQMGTNDTCDGASEAAYSFIGRVGTVLEIVSGADAKYRVTFNGGRSAYLFREDDVQLEPTRHNYELWWVDRMPQSPTYLVRKKKPFRVTAPRCTYDATRQRALPYAILNRQRYAGEAEEATHLIQTLYR